MKKATVAITSTSSGNTYDITAIENEGRISLQCSCAAGEKGSFCKHRLQILTGNYSGVTGDIEEVKAILSTDAVKKFTVEYLSTLKTLEADEKRIKMAIADHKKKFSRALLSGF